MTSFLDPPGGLLDPSFPLPLDRPFTNAEAIRSGISRNLLGHLVEAGLLRRLTQRVYVAAQVPDSRELRAAALTLVAPPGTVICDWTACWYWTGMDRPGRHSEVEVDAFRLRGHERLRSGLARSGQRSFAPDDVISISENLFVTTPIRTAWDLGRFNVPVVAMGGMDALHRIGAFSVEELVEDLPRFKGQRGVVLLRWLAPRVDGRSESFGESGLRVRWEEAPGLPKPTPQIRLLDEAGHEMFRLDLGDEETLFCAEYDGEEFHGPDRVNHDRSRRASVGSDFGYWTEVFRRNDVFGPLHDASRRLAMAFRESRKTLHERRRRRNSR